MIASFLWASSFIYIEIGLEDLEPTTFAALRYLIGAAVLVGYWLYRGGAATRTLQGSTETLLVVALAVMLYTAVPALQFFGLDQTEAVTFNFVFQAGIPLVLALSAGLILKEQTSPWEWLGVVVVVAGAYVFFPLRPGGADARGVLLAIAAAVFIGASNVIQRRILRRPGTSALELTTISMALGAFVLGVLALAVDDPPSFDLRLLVLLLVLGVVNTAIAFFIWHRAMQTLRALHAGVIASSQLVFVPALAVWFLDEAFGFRRALGSLLVIGGIFVVHYMHATARSQTTQ